MKGLGVIAIGRNEGERLRRCLESLGSADLPIVYVDSGSTDGSQEMARSRGVEVVDLDLSIPFTAARARNAGCERLREMHPGIEYVQFIDGDCEVAAGWCDAALSFMKENPRVAVVCGRRRERHPEYSIWNRLCDIEWDTPVGEARDCGGDSMMRVAAFQEVGGFNPKIIAGEEPELCVRLRQAGWTIFRLDAEMTVHDAAMTSIRQWWKRSMRTGFGYSLGAHLHGRPPIRHWVRECRRLVLWGFLFPMSLIGLAWPTHGWSLLGFVVYPLQAARIAWRTRRRGTRNAIAYGISCVASKFPEFIGWCKFQRARRRGGPMRLIEYK